MIAGHFRWSIREPELPQDLRPILADPDAFLGPNAHFIKDTRVVTIARAKINRANPVGLVIRRLNYGKFKHRLRDWIRPSRARRAFAHAARFERAAIRTPHALAASERRRLGWPLTAYLITEEVYGAQTLADYLIAHPDPPVRVALQIADLIAQIHLAGFSHRDLKFTNILLTPELCPVIIDLDGVRRGGPRRRTRDFARFDLDLIQYPTAYNKWREPLQNRYAARMRRSGL